MTPAELMPPGQYRVTVEFDTGTDERLVITVTEREKYYIYHQAIADMRLASAYGGPGTDGKVLDWKVEPDTHLEKKV